VITAVFPGPLAHDLTLPYNLGSYLESDTRSIESKFHLHRMVVRQKEAMLLKKARPWNGPNRCGL
jgi:hypothetical protein